MKKPTKEVEAILSLMEAAGSLTPAEVVVVAADPKSPLHAYFEWDDKAAGYQYRKDQARELIRSCKMEFQYHSVTFEAPAFIPNPTKHGVYIALTRLCPDEDACRNAVVIEFARAASALTRARTIAAALGLEDEIAGLLKRVIGLSDRIELGAAGTA